MGHNRRRKTIPRWTNEDMMKAIKEVREGSTQRQAAIKYKIPTTSLLRRIHSGLDKPLRNVGGQMVFNEDQEEILVSRILQISACGFKLTREDIRRIAFDFAESKGIRNNFSKSKKMAGLDWLIGFRNRKPVVQLRKAKGITIAHGLDKQGYFSLLKKTQENLDLLDKPELIYNCHVAVFHLPKEETEEESQNKDLKKHELVSVIVCSNATGEYIPSMSVYNENHGPKFSIGFPVGTMVKATPSGWIDEEAFLEWIIHFHAHRRPGPCLLILDGHSSHKTLSVYQFCETNSIYMICLPGYVPHKLHPLESPFLSLLRSYYDKFLSNVKEEKKLEQVTFGAIFRKAWLMAAKVNVAEEGFALTGVYPLNPEAEVLKMNENADPEESQIECEMEEDWNDEEDTGYDLHDVGCAFCGVNHSDPISGKMGGWIQCQGKAKEWYHRYCVGVTENRSFQCGRCFSLQLLVQQNQAETN